MPSIIEQVNRDYRDRGLVVYAVNIEETRRRVAKWVEKNHSTVPVLLDPAGDASAAYRISAGTNTAPGSCIAYRITATPTVFLIGRDGRFVAKAIGTKEWTSEHGRALLQRLLGR